MRREEIGFIEDESKKQDNSSAFEGGHSSITFQNMKKAIFQLVRAPFGKLLRPFYLWFLR